MNFQFLCISRYQSPNLYATNNIIIWNQIVKNNNKDKEHKYIFKIKFYFTMNE